MYPLSYSCVAVFTRGRFAVRCTCPPWRPRVTLRGNLLPPLSSAASVLACLALLPDAPASLQGGRQTSGTSHMAEGSQGGTRSKPSKHAVNHWMCQGPKPGLMQCSGTRCQRWWPKAPMNDRKGVDRAHCGKAQKQGGGANKRSIAHG